MTAYRSVTIPACVEHQGFYQMTVMLPWVCMHCGGPRGEPHDVRSYDGSLWMNVDGWDNPCGHAEKYQAVREWVSREQAPKRGVVIIQGA